MVDVNTLQFSSDALSLLNSNYKEFREEFGDYFVAGYTWGDEIQGSNIRYLRQQVSAG